MTDPESLYDPSSPVINASLTEHHCFGCGDQNPIGLQLRFRELSDGRGVWAEFTPTQDHEGYLGMVHGGILSTMIDEAMSWAITANSVIGVTGRMEISFRHPAAVGRPMIVAGRVLHLRRRVIDVEGEIRDSETQQLVASATARFVRVSQEQAQAWQEAYRAGSETVFGHAARSTNTASDA